MGCDKSMCTDCATINPLSEVQFGRYLVIGGAEVQFVAGMSIAVTRKHTELNRKKGKGRATTPCNIDKREELQPNGAVLIPRRPRIGPPIPVRQY